MRLAALLLLLLFPTGEEFSGPPAQVYQHAMDVLSNATVGNRAQAFDALQRIGNDGYLLAQYALGTMYESGSVVPAQLTTSFSWYKRAADQGDRLALWAVGRMYLDGSGATRDRDQALAFFRRAADAGDPFGAHWYATALLQTNDPGSFAAFKRAAQLGSPQAQLQFATMLNSGQYGMPDAAQAYTWAILSVAGGNEAGRTLMSSIAGSLPSDVRAAAEQQAADMAPSVRWDYVSRGCTGWDGEFSAAPSPPPARLQTQCRSAGAR